MSDTTGNATDVQPVRRSAKELALSPKQVRELLYYDPVAGIFKWRASVSRRMRSGMAAGTVNSNGYLIITIRGRLYTAGRLAWAYVRGEWPQQQIDHVNGNRLDNRFANLRDVPPRINCENLRPFNKANKTGLRGVRVTSTRQVKFAAEIKVRGKIHRLGYFPNPEAAHAKYVEAKRLLHEGCTI